MELADRDYFTDHSVLKDPYAFFEALRAKGPVHQLTNRDMVIVTGHEEILQVLRNTEDFSAIITTAGPVTPLPFEPEGDDITAQIEAHRAEFAGGDLLIAFDEIRHAASRSILNQLFTPSRLKANEEFMRDFADQLVRDAVAKGTCDIINEIATPYVTLVVADLLGVPADDREKFRAALDAVPPPGTMDEQPQSVSVLEYMAGFFVGYVTDRRANPREDVLTILATAKYPDGSLPDLMEPVRIAVFLFAAGQDTSAKLIGNALRFLVETPGLQQQLRDDRSLIPNFIEEVLRLEGSTKATWRLARKKTKVGDLEIPPGKKVVLALAAANRDPRRWEDPQEFKFGREKMKEHVAFGRGAHVCAGAPLARVEVRELLDRLLEHTSDITLSPRHGPAGNNNLEYEPSYVIRGLAEMHIDLKPA